MLNISTFPWAEYSLLENEVETISDSLSLRRSRRTTGVMRYEVELVTIDMEMAQGRSIKAQLSRARRRNELITFIHPRLSYSLGIEPVGGVEFKTAHVKGDDTVSVGPAVSGTWELKAGDYIQPANDTKIYEVALDTGPQTSAFNVELTHPLRASVSIGDAVTMNAVPWFFHINSVIDFSTEAVENQDMQLTVTLVEDL